jgi:hydroxypyruvate isomerase
VTLRFAANIGMLFGEVPFLQRFGRAARAGFAAVEYPFPYEYSQAELADALAQHGLVQVLFNLPPGDWARGERGIACDPARVGEFHDGVGLALEYARALGVSQVNCLAGIPPQGVDAELCRRTLLDNLRFASEALERAGVRLLVEPINGRDMPGFFLQRSRDARALIEELKPVPLWLQYDVYHMQVMEGDLALTLEELLPVIAHIQIADHPGRHEPGSGEIHFPFLFAWLERIGYAGWVGCEYRPLTTTEAGLDWLERQRAPAGR